MTCRSILLAALLLLALPVLAEPEPYNRVDLQNEAGREIANDLMQAQMSVEINDPQPAPVAQKLTDTLNAALKQAAGFPGVKVSSGSQNTYPVYGKNNRLDGWRGRGELRLESADFRAAGELIALLQQHLQLRGVSFTVAANTRLQAENGLTTEAIAAFRKRADTVREAMGGKSYKIVHLAINGGREHLRPMMLEQRGISTSSAMPVPEFSAGESRMTMQVSGTIEIIY